MKRVYCALIAAVILVPAAADAYVPSERYGAFELKFGPYTPNVDDEPGLTGTPYADALNNDTMFLTLIEVDWAFFVMRGINLALGFQWGFMQAYAPSLTESGSQSADYTVLNVMPFAVLGVIRIDVLPEFTRVPLVPYFKGGLNWYLWWVLGSGESVEEAGTMGWQINPGMAILLDWLDETSARTIDNEAGINNSYIFFEVLYAQVEGYGRDGFMYLSPTDLAENTTFLIGLCLEF
jgi:opacity protein-like surface antigen